MVAGNQKIEAEERSDRIAMLSTFPPTPCGIATFAAALSSGLEEAGASVTPVDVTKTSTSGPEGEVSTLGLRQTVAALNSCDAVIVQHEYGIYPGPFGASILDIVDGVDVPVIVVAHTVPNEPLPQQRRILTKLCRTADAVVVMTDVARTRLQALYDVGGRTTVVIPHGAAVGSSPESRDTTRSRILTWGLLGPGKGIEWAIEAMASLVDLDPRPEYVIAGATHPNIVERDGERYRNMLIGLALEFDLADRVMFDDRYRDVDELSQLISTADVVVLPYDSVDQVTSGVLVDAVAAGRPVISTAFPHATELLDSGAGIVVPQRDPFALSSAIRAVLTDTELATDMSAEAQRLAPGLAWTAVARRYRRLADSFAVKQSQAS